ncbi:acyl-CoA desaturase [Chitinivorax sp. B]|uniref:acyl-CoA desaturase n=1 Tax=Chitinivorax sp. B TaxID=2502235 RepID=UPI0010F8FE6F|nr:acyl-CoA desaturase [Chitinivorax sp. B]
MSDLQVIPKHHRVQVQHETDVVQGSVKWAPAKSFWFTGMLFATLIGGSLTWSWSAFGVFLASTAAVLLFGHSLGSHRKLIHDSYQCPRWLEYTLVYMGVQVGLSGPLGLLRQHDLRDFAQRLPDCHDYLRHRNVFWRDAWWQLNCELILDRPPKLNLEPRVANDRFYQFLERTWMWQQLPPAIVLYMLGGWAFVFWGVCARITAGVFGHWLVGYFAHNQGDMHFEVTGAAVQGHNIHLVSLLTMGECWHNNHHAFPGSAKLGLAPGEWDPGWWALKLMARVGWVWGIRLPADLPHRAVLQPCHVDAMSMVQRAGTSLTLPATRQWSVLWGVMREWSAHAQRATPTISGPVANLSPSQLRWLVGERIPFSIKRTSRRVSLQVGEQRIDGLPAICLVWFDRGGLFRGAAIVLLPVACMVETVRSWVELPA